MSLQSSPNSFCIIDSDEVKTSGWEKKQDQLQPGHLHPAFFYNTSQFNHLILKCVLCDILYIWNIRRLSYLISLNKSNSPLQCHLSLFCFYLTSLPISFANQSKPKMVCWVWLPKTDSFTSECIQHIWVVGFQFNKTRILQTL